MKEYPQVTLSTEEMILELVRSLDEKVDELSEGQADIKAQIATHEERSLNQGKRIERVEKITGGISLAVIVAVMSIVLSGCGLFAGLVPKQDAPVAPAPPRIDVVGRAISNTVSIHDAEGNRYCTGVAVESAILTAEHCVENHESFQIFYRGEMYPGVIISENEDQDWAIIDAIGARIKDSVPLAEKDPVTGNKVIWTGYPLGEDFIMGTGIVGNPSVSVRGIDPSIRWMAVYGQFIPGNSGGPVFNYHGELIGIVSMTMTYNNNYLPVGYAVPLSTIRAAL